MNKYIVLGGIGALIFMGGRKVIDSKDIAENKAKYSPLIAAAEKKHGIPSWMLFRLINAESHFRTDIITGATRSKVGALGIAQFMPKTAKQELGSVNAALNPAKAIDGAGRYLKKQLAWTKNRGWIDAVAAYNWGAGNVNKFRAGTIANMPEETRNYIAAIIT